MPITDEREYGRLLRSTCINAIGFADLLSVHRFSEVRRMQYRAFMIGHALTLADLILNHGRLIAHFLPHKDIEGLKKMARNCRYLITSLDGENPDLQETQSREFARYVLRVIEPID